MKELYNQLHAVTDPLETIEISDKILNNRLRTYILNMFLKGESLLSLAKFDEALSVFTQILEYDDERFNGRAHNSIGFCYSMQNKPRKAESEFKKAHEYSDKSSLLLNSAILNIATYYSQTNKKEDTYKIFKELYDLDPSNGYNDSYILLLTMSNNPEEFIAICDSTIDESYAVDIDVLRIKGLALINLGKFNEAIPVFEDIIKYSDDNDIIGVSHTFLGYCYLTNNELDKAICEYEKAYKYCDELSRPDKLSLLESLAHVYQMANQNEKAFEVLNELSEIDPANQRVKRKIENLKREINGEDSLKNNSIEEAIVQADIYSARNEYEKVIEVYDSITDELTNDNYSCEIYKNKGLALINLKRFDEAIECYDKAIKISPNDFKSWNNKAFALHNLNRLNEAIECYDKALKINPTHTSALGNKAFALRMLNRLDETIECYDKILKINPNDFNVWNNKAFCLHQLNRSDEALECYDKSLEINPNYFEAWANKGFTLENLDRIDEAVECYNRALTISPNHPDMLNRLSFIKAKKNGSEIVDLYF